jgi:hypothetical protein
MSAFYRIVEWDKYQHYKDRDPPWIKLHRDTLTSRTWVNCDDRARVLALACMLIAAGTDNKIPADPEFLKRRAYLNKEPDFAPLVASGFVELVNDDNTVADASKVEQTQASATKCSSEERRDREEEEERAFAMFALAAKRNNRPEPSKLTDDRRKKLRARLDEHGIDGWQKMLDLSDASEFLNKTFPLKIDWVLEPKNLRKVLEGNYANNKSAPKVNGFSKPDPQALPAAEPWEQRMYGWSKSNGKFWQSTWGPKPGENGCRVPASLLASH